VSAVRLLAAFFVPISAVLVVSGTISRLNDYRAKYGEYEAYL
jgi:hypothetical protein